MNLELTKLYSRNSELENNLKELTEKYNAKNHCNINYFFEDNKINVNKPFLYIATLDGKTAGFLSAFVFDECEMEIVIIPSPDYDEKAINEFLYEALKQDYRHYYVQSYSDNNTSHHAKNLELLGFKYQKTECIMAINDFEYKNKCDNISLNIYETDSTIYYYALENNVPIGRCVADIEGDIASISNVKVVELFRRKGYATKMLSMALDDLFKKYSYAILHVTKENEPAFRLYNNLGFHLEQSVASYEAKI